MLSLFFILLGALSKSFMDYCSDGISLHQWWNKGESWKKKYKNPMETTDKSTWYYLGLYKPKYKEKFIYSSTILVWLTDGWHFFQMVFLTFMMLSVVFYWPVFNIGGVFFSVLLDFLLYRISFGFSFEIVYYILKRVKK